MPEITIKNISKKFRLTGAISPNITLRDQIVKLVKHPFKKSKQGIKNDFWALRNINLEINKGDVIGLIGKNGSGKSTLLKIISRIITPTEGRIIVRGKVTSLLEVGTGFHPELTGRENIFLNSAIYGMSNKEIKNKFQEIVDFSGIGKFLETPIKFYSSGMYVRLAFAIAIYLDSDILLIDEVLSVGDYEFQKKCLSKINNIAKDGKRTIIFVSHNLEEVKNICNKAVLLIDGAISEIGNPEDVVRNYLMKFSEKRNYLTFDFNNAPGNDLFKIKSLRVIFADNKQHATIIDSVNIECDFWNLIEDNQNINFSMLLYNSTHCVLNSISPVVNLKKGEYKFVCRIPGNLLNNGEYSAKIIISKNFSAIFALEEMCTFELSDSREINWFGIWPGSVRPKLAWEFKENNQ
jgi:lipopolysaccharide transport system ATP-binding protein